MDNTQALQVIKQALEMANAKGVYNLQNSSLIVQALSKLNEIVENTETKVEVESEKESE